MGNAFLTGAEATIWDGTNDDDLLTLLPRGNEADPFTGFLRERLLSVYHNLVGRHQEVYHIALTKLMCKTLTSP